MANGTRYKAEILEPQQRDFALTSEWNYAMSVWHESRNKIATAQLFMQRALYHQEREHMEEFKLRQLRPAPLTKKLKTREDAKVERDLEAAHLDRTDAAAMAKNLYARNRARSPLKDEMPTWDKLTRRTQDTFIIDAVAAITILDDRRAFRKEQANGS